VISASGNKKDRAKELEGISPLFNVNHDILIDPKIHLLLLSVTWLLVHLSVV
jgi:hypothetical protein